ncbi:DUF2971 domain-containing protein [Bacillus sp. JJ1773]|uniref:DUF2971 domain-containing protein n=1 Tax=Bacillus sp. JJ1773 TaxID=3122965 RepID=UPI002FFFDF77
MNKVLYKYRAINDNTLNILKENKIWYANVASLNDPNEGLLREITSTQASDFINKTKENQMSGFVFSMFMALKSNTLFYGLNNTGIKKLQKKIASKKGIERKYKYINRFLQEKVGRGFTNPEGFLNSIHSSIEDAGILSLSEDPLNNLMWSHYANNHQGIAIGINNYKSDDYKMVNYNLTSDIPKIDLTEYFSIFKIYKEKNTYEIAFNDPSLQEILLTKTAEWQYEKEWRGLKGKYGLFPLNGNVTEVVFGLNCIKSNRDKIRKIIEENSKSDILFKEVYQNPSSYDFLLRNC